MARRYGSHADYMLCCLFAAGLCVLSKRARITIAILLSLSAIIVVFSSLGWDLIVRAFLESLSLINQTVGQVLYGIAVVIIVLGLKVVGHRKSITAQRVLQLLGLTVAVGFCVWGIVFIVEACVGVPREVRVEAESNLSPKFRWRLPSPPGGALTKNPPHIFLGSAAVVTFVHNLNTMAPQVRCFDSEGNQFQPGAIKVLSSNVVRIIDAVPMPGGWCGAK